MYMRESHCSRCYSRFLVGSFNNLSLWSYSLEWLLRKDAKMLKKKCSVFRFWECYPTISATSRVSLKDNILCFDWIPNVDNKVRN